MGSLYQEIVEGTSLADQWLGLRTSTVGATGSIPGQGTKILHVHSAAKKKKKKKKKKERKLLRCPRRGPGLGLSDQRMAYNLRMAALSRCDFLVWRVGVS